MSFGRPREGTPATPGRRITRRAFVAGLAAVAAASAVDGCGSSEDEETTMTTTSSQPIVDLPPPSEGTVPLEAALRRRRSVREFTDEPLTDAEIGQLLWAAQGVTAEWGGRTAPSAGAHYPLELHALTPTGALHYLPDGHRVEMISADDLRPDLEAAALDQPAVGGAPLVTAVVVVPERTAATYGDRAGRYVDLEAGHAAQNLLLQAVALDLVAVPIGAFDDDAVAEILGLPPGHEVRYLLPVGRPRS